MHNYLTWQSPGALKWLWLVIPLLGLAWYATRARQAGLAAFLGARYVPSQWRWHRRRRIAKDVLLIVAFGLLLIALARPRIGVELQKVGRKGARLDWAVVPEVLEPRRYSDVRQGESLQFYILAEVPAAARAGRCR